MLKFFRKIRQQLLIENKISKYLIYAIGEIILVVIGILIAISINNNNEKRKNEEKIITILKEIQADLSTDIDETRKILNAFIEIDSLTSLILDKKLKPDDFKFENINFLYNANGIHISSNGYQNLILNIDILPEKFNPILKELNFLYDKAKNLIDISKAKSIKFTFDNMDYLMKNKEWFNSLIVGEMNDEMIHYFLNDPQLRNKLGFYINHFDVLIKYVNHYRIAAIDTHYAISKLIESETDPDENINYTVDDVEVLKQYAGLYQLRDVLNSNQKNIIEISIDGNQLFSKNIDDKYNEEEKVALFFHSKTIFFIQKEFDLRTFNKDSTGIIISMRVRSNFVNAEWIKIK